MRTRQLVTLSATLVVLAATACQRRSDEPAVTKTTAAGQPAATAAGQPAATAAPQAVAPAALSKDDREFITKAAQGGTLEVELGKQVAAKASAASVKTFGNQMVTDHGKANDELKELAMRKGFTPPTDLGKDQQKVFDKLAKLSGPKLDKEYASDMVEDHEEDIKEFKKASEKADDPELRAWAAKTVPILEHHLAMSKDMEKQTK